MTWISDNDLSFMTGFRSALSLGPALVEVFGKFISRSTSLVFPAFS